MSETKPLGSFCDDVLGDADGVEIARRIRAGEIQACEAVEASISRAERVNPGLNAIATPMFDLARREARIARPGALAGVPTFIKDNDAVTGAPVLMGSRAMPRRLAEESSPFVRQFSSTGLIHLGKSTMCEFGLTATSEALVYGATHNPWKLGFSPGGSSGGSAALVAAGVVPIAHANDGGGSTRAPASCCGLVGLKPSRGRLVEMEGSVFMPVKILHQGMLSRSVRDTAVFYEAAERHYRNPRLPEIGRVTRPGRRLRIGFFSDPGRGEAAHPDCAAAVRAAAELCESLGHTVVEVPRPFDERFHEDFLSLWAMLAFALTRLGRQLVDPELDRSKVEPFTEGLAQYCKETARGIPAAIWRLRKFAHRYARGFGSYDVLMNPTLAMPPPEHGYVGPEVPFETALERLRDLIPFTQLQNVSGGPAISLPLAQSASGLPIGVQFAAPMGDERRLLELAFELEEASPWPRLGA